MADQDFRETLRVALRDFDDNHLHKVMVAAYDRWCWDSGSEMDKDWYEVADELLKERGVMSSSSTLSFGGNATGVSIGSSDPIVDQDLVISAKKVQGRDPGSTWDRELFDFSSGCELGFDLKQAVADAVAEFMTNGLSTKQGLTLRDIVKQAAKDAIREAV